MYVLIYNTILHSSQHEILLEPGIPRPSLTFLKVKGNCLIGLKSPLHIFLFEWSNVFQYLTTNLFQ